MLKGKTDPHAAKVAISSKQWRLSKRDPDRFSDRIKVDAAVNVDVSKLSDEEFQAKLRDEWRRVSLSDAIPLDLFEEVLEERKSGKNSVEKT